MHPDQNKNNSKHPAAMLKPKRSLSKTKGHRIICIKSDSLHNCHSLEICRSSSVELSSTPQTSKILVCFRGREVSVLQKTLETALVNVFNPNATNFSFSYLKQDIQEVEYIPTL